MKKTNNLSNLKCDSNGLILWEQYRKLQRNTPNTHKPPNIHIHLPTERELKGQWYM